MSWWLMFEMVGESRRRVSGEGGIMDANCFSEGGCGSDSCWAGDGEGDGVEIAMVGYHGMRTTRDEKLKARNDHLLKNRNFPSVFYRVSQSSRASIRLQASTYTPYTPQRRTVTRTFG
jgi:hypothetical protein